MSNQLYRIQSRFRTPFDINLPTDKGFKTIRLAYREKSALLTEDEVNSKPVTACLVRDMLRIIPESPPSMKSPGIVVSDGGKDTGRLKSTRKSDSGGSGTSDNGKKVGSK